MLNFFLSNIETNLLYILNFKMSFISDQSFFTVKHRNTLIPQNFHSDQSCMTTINSKPLITALKLSKNKNFIQTSICRSFVVHSFVILFGLENIALMNFKIVSIFKGSRDS